MKVSTRARYGMRLMLALAIEYGRGSVFLKDIAKKEEISEKYLGQIIIALKAGHLVKSFRGAHGGYVLDRPPAQITLRDIVEMLEGDLALVGCVKNPSSCRRISICVTQEIWSRLSSVISETLGAVTLQDLVEMYRKRVPGNAADIYYI